MSRSTDPWGTPAFCARVLEVIASEPFDLGHGVSVTKTCSVGWAAYPWSRGGIDCAGRRRAVSRQGSGSKSRRGYCGNRRGGSRSRRGGSGVDTRGQSSTSANHKNRVPSARIDSGCGP
jgi:hypothetical protein